METCNLKKELVDRYITPLEPLPTELGPEGELKGRVKCLLCDIYGTLFISASGDLNLDPQRAFPDQALTELAARYGLSFTGEMLQQRLHACIQATHRQARDNNVDYPEVDIEEIWSRILGPLPISGVRRFAVEYEMIMNPVWPMPGLKEMIGMCRRNGMRLGIVSNAQFFTPLLFDWFLDADLPSLGFDRQLIFLSYKIGQAKPSALLFDMAANALQAIGIAVHEVAVIGNDMRNDIAPSQKAGFQTILFAGDARSLRLRSDAPDCIGVVPDLRITHLTQLASHLPKVLP